MRPERIRRFAAELARRLACYEVETVCGPLVEGAFVGLLVAAELRLQFSYAERFARPQPDTLYPVGYRIPAALRGQVCGKRVAIVNDVINAGSAVRGTFTDLLACGAVPVAIGALPVSGTSAATFAADKGIILESLASRPNALWLPSQCPLCASGVPLEDAAGFAVGL